VTPLTGELLGVLRSPDSGRPLRTADDGALVTEDGAERFPVAGGVPLLLGRASPFSAAAYAAVPEGRGGSGAGARLKALARRVLPSLSHNLVARGNFERLRELLHHAHPGGRPRILVVGGSVAGEGFEELLADPGLELVETDVALGPRTALVCDAHDLPFADATFDAVVCQAVLEHVADPPRVVAEVRRVLRPAGLVYSEIPFMQQVHEGAHDFTRYSLTGHRRLVRDFIELGSGAVAGPGMALGWSARAFGLGIVGSRPAARAAVNLATTLALWWLKELDRFLLRDPAGLDGASGTWFLGRLAATPRSDREILAAHRGADAGFSMDRS
jgi:SAM-dependent methyltransferase